MPNPAHHHCHLFTDFYKGLICAEPKPFLTARKSDTPIFWKACLLVVPAGFNPRTYSIGTLQKDVEKTLKSKQHTDPATKLPPKLHKFFELFFHQEANKLPPHRFYDHKIKFIKVK